MGAEFSEAGPVSTTWLVQRTKVRSGSLTVVQTNNMHFPLFREPPQGVQAYEGTARPGRLVERGRGDIQGLGIACFSAFDLDVHLHRRIRQATGVGRRFTFILILLRPCFIDFPFPIWVARAVIPVFDSRRTWLGSRYANRVSIQPVQNTVPSAILPLPVKKDEQTSCLYAQGFHHCPFTLNRGGNAF